MNVYIQDGLLPANPFVYNKDGIAMAIDGFSEIYSKLNSMEKDIAFAEIANDKVTLANLENLKKTLTETGEGLLKSKGLSFRALSPIFACEKCNDTGYVGTERCDCFNKKVK